MALQAIDMNLHTVKWILENDPKKADWAKKKIEKLNQKRNSEIKRIRRLMKTTPLGAKR